MIKDGQMFDFHVGAMTDKGRVRSHNEDSLAVFPMLGVWAVADGMGGHAAGDVASATIVEELSSLGVAVSAQDQRARVMERLDRAHRRIAEHVETQGLGTAGSTIAAVLIYNTELNCIWAGDSRVYLLRDGVLTPLTRDHSEVAMMVAAGTITAEEARVAPRRNVITRAVGIGRELHAEQASGVVKSGDRLLLCSDGLTEHLDNNDLATFLSASLSAVDTAARLIEETLQRGAKDNVSVIVIDCEMREVPDEPDEWSDV